jgi:hypothetical protein
MAGDPLNRFAWFALAARWRRHWAKSVLSGSSSCTSLLQLFGGWVGRSSVAGDSSVLCYEALPAETGSRSSVVDERPSKFFFLRRFGGLVTGFR